MESLDFILTCDDAGRFGEENITYFSKFVSMLNEYNIKATFFAVPHSLEGPPLNERDDWVNVIKKALGEGHDIQLHGYNHDKFEFGIPSELALSLYDPLNRSALIKKINSEKSSLEASLTSERITEKLIRGKQMFEEVFEISPICFRSPLLGESKNLYLALESAKIGYCSNRSVNPRGWKYIKGEVSKSEWDKEKLLLPKKILLREKLTELPISCEYSWFLQEEEFERAMETIKKDAIKISGIKDSFMMPLSHFYAVMRSPAGERFYRDFFEYALKNFNFKSHTIRSYVESLQKNGH